MVAKTTAAKEELATSYRVHAAIARTFTTRIPRPRRNWRSHTGSTPRSPARSRRGSPAHGGIGEVTQGPRRDRPDVHDADPPPTEELAKSYRVRAAIDRTLTTRIP